MKWSLLLLFFFSLSAHAVDTPPQGWSLSLSGQKYQLQASYISQQHGSSTFVPHLGYGFAFFRQGADTLRINFAIQPLVEEDALYDFIAEVNISFLFEPPTWEGWHLEVRFGPQIWAPTFSEEPEGHFFRGLGLGRKLSEGTSLVGMIGQSDFDGGENYTHLRLGLEFVL